MRTFWILVGTLCGLLGGVVLVAAVISDDSEELPPLTEGGTALEAGTYTTAKFRPQTRFEIEDGWTTTSPEVADYFDIARTDAFEAISFVRARSVALPQDPTGQTHASAPNDLANWIRAHPRLDLERSSKAEVDGLPASQIDATVRSAPAELRFCRGPCLPLFVPSDRRPVTYELGDKLRFLVVKTDRGLVTIVVAAPKKRFRSFLPEAEDVISSVEFSPG